MSLPRLRHHITTGGLPNTLWPGIKDKPGPWALPGWEGAQGDEEKTQGPVEGVPRPLPSPDKYYLTSRCAQPRPEGPDVPGSGTRNYFPPLAHYT